MKKRFILVGAGGFAVYWQETLLPQVKSFMECVAVVDINADTLEAAKAFSAAPVDCYYIDLKAALESHPCDFIALVVPPDARPGLIDLAIEFGVDVLCEKPVAASMKDSVLIYKKMKAAGRKIAVTMSHRMEREKQTLESLVKSGDYGKLNYIYGRLAMRRPVRPASQLNTAKRDPYTSARRGLSEGAIHELDVLRAISGANAATVFCDFWQFEPGDGSQPNSTFIMVTMENGVRCVVEHSGANATTRNGWSNEYFRAECAEATLIADRKQVTVRSDMGHPHPAESQMSLMAGEYFDHTMIMRDFCLWLDGGPEPPTSLEDNLQCNALVFAALESAVTGKPVDVQAFLAEALEG